MRIAATQLRQTPGCFPSDQQAKPLMDQRCPLPNARVKLGLFQQVVIEIDGGPHTVLPD